MLKLYAERETTVIFYIRLCVMGGPKWVKEMKLRISFNTQILSSFAFILPILRIFHNIQHNQKL